MEFDEGPTARHCWNCEYRIRHENTVCPECGGSLQQRYLRAGCLSSSPGLVLLGLGLAWLLRQLA